MGLAAAVVVGLGGAGVGFAQQGDLVFSDHFSDPASGWLVYEDQTVTCDYADGRYLIAVREVEQAKWVWSPAGPYPADFTAQVEGWGPTGGEANYGLVWGTDDSNFYLFRIGNDGGYGVDHMAGGQWQAPPLSWQTSRAIKRDGSPNRLGVTVRGKWVTLTVNGEFLRNVAVTNLGPVYVGLAVYFRDVPREGRVDINVSLGPIRIGTTLSSEEAGEVEVHFDDLTIRG